MKQCMYKLQALIENKSPISIGSGNNTQTDKDILLDKSGFPLIPATAFIGVFREYLLSNNVFTKKEIDNFFGQTGDNSQQSLVMCQDLPAQTSDRKKVLVRDGIRINPATGIVEKNKKFDYQIADAGIPFILNLTINCDKNESETVTRLLKLLLYGLSKDKIRIGGRTNAGLGALSLKSYTIEFFDFTVKKDTAAFLLNKNGQKIVLDYENAIDVNAEELVLTADFNLRTSLIVRSYPTSPELPDAVHLTSNGKLVLPGSSLKGAIRARAEKILNTILDPVQQKEIIDDLFGFVTEEKNSQEQPNAAKGRIIVAESILPAFTQYLQNRIKIDRFTGGVIETALFDSVPLFPSATINLNEQIVKLQISVKKCKPYEAGLLILVLKDLWTGDIALGGEKNVGRGVLNGIRAELKFKNHTIPIGENPALLPDDAKATLNSFVKALVERKAA